MLQAHVAAYSEIKSIIQKQIITDHKVLHLSVLREKYINELLEQNQPNNDFQSEKLKKKLEKDPDISELIAFLRSNGMDMSHSGCFLAQKYQLRKLWQPHIYSLLKIT